MDDLDLSSSNARDLEMNDTSSFNLPNLKPSLQQKRNTQERLRLHIPKHTIRPEATNSVHFDVDNQASEHPPSQKHESKSSPPSPKERGFWIAFSPGSLQWIPKNLNRTSLQPVIRCAISAWISLLLVLIPRTERFLGQSSFIILIASFLSPPAGPFISVVEKEIVVQLTVTGAYAWSCLGIMLANLARNEVSTSADVSDILKGRYIEAMPSIVCAIFLCVGTSLLLYWRAKMGHGKPVTASMILSCTVMDSALTIAPLYPYPNYQTGKALVVPIAFHSIIAIICALCIFPESIHAQFRHRFRAIFSPLVFALRTQPSLLRTAPTLFDADFDAGVNEYTTLVQSAEAALGPLAATGRLMKKDISYSRFCAGDFKAMHELTRRMTVRANGMAFYFKIMDPSRHKFPGTPAASPINSYPPSRAISRPSSPPSTPNEHIVAASPKSANGSGVSRRRRTHAPQGPHGYFHLSHHNHGYHNGISLFKEIRVRGPEHAVGVFESQAYLNLETRFTHAEADVLRARTMGSLGVSAEPLLMRCVDTLEHVGNWLQRVNDDRLWKRLVRRKGTLKWREIVQENEDIKTELIKSLEEFRKSRRHCVLDLYRSSLDPRLGGTPGGDDPPPHRYLFQCYLYQYHLIHFTKDLIDFVGEITRLETTRLQCKVWLPIHPLRKLFVWNRWEPSDNNDPEDDEDPDLVSGIRPESQGQLGFAAKRDPDALPPHTALEAYGRALYRAFSSLGTGNAVFAFKAGVMAALLSLPSFLPGSVELAISNRSVWAIVLGQTTLSRFRGDTVAGLISRILSTFFGGVIGLIMWYISSGNGAGNAYALGALAAICFPFFFFARIYYPGPPINVIFFFLTSQLVLGFSWEDTHLPSISVTGYGFTVAWKRFLMVTIGVTVAFIFSFLPPSTTLRRYLRTTYATTSEQLGQLYCDILSLATVSDKIKTEEIVKNLVAVRMKLNRTCALRQNVIYEFSLQGRWPAERYKRVLEIQMEIAYLLSHLRSVEEHLEPEWGRAFLRRTRFMDSEFQGDILSVICMISIALRTGIPLPQVTPCPLLDRFVAHNSGIDDYGLPRAITIETLENEQYLYFSVGVATAFGIITRLDRLMLATKELVGEQYHIQGVLDMSRRMTSEKMHL